MANIREILAQNLREHRRKLGITQPELAERAGLSIHHIAMIEIGRRFPSPGVLDKLAAALDINPHELFAAAVSPDQAMKQLQALISENVYQAVENALDSNIEKVIEKALDRALEKHYGKVRKAN